MVRTVPTLIIFIHLRCFIISGIDIGAKVKKLDIEGLIIGPFGHIYSGEAVDCISIGEGELAIDEHLIVDIGFVL